MNVTINDTPLVLFHGATLKHALLKLDEALYHAVKKGEAFIQDQDGNPTDIDGAVGDGFSYYVVSK